MQVSSDLLCVVNYLAIKVLWRSL